MRFAPLTLAVPLALLALGACSAADQAPAGAGDPTVSPVKSDCPDCDPAGPNAFVQAGIGAGFYEVGDHWQVAWRYTSNPMIEMRDDVFLGTDVAQSEAFLFDYRVTAVDRDVFDNVLRDTVTVEVTQAAPAGAHADLYSPERIDQFEQKVVFTMNDLLEPVRETVYSRDYPHGKTVELDTKSSLKTGASLYPRTIPRLLVAHQVDAPAPALPADLKDIADAVVPGWDAETYLKVTFDNGDVVYWGKGDGRLWPFFTATADGAGLLVSYE